LSEVAPVEKRKKASALRVAPTRGFFQGRYDINSTPSVHQARITSTVPSEMEQNHE
jgi:hypothetical protein